MSFSVRLTREAEDDLLRWVEFLIDQELARDGGNPARADEAPDAIKGGLKLLERFPFTCRKVGSSPFLRELIIPFASTGYVALFEIIDSRTVVVAGVRHQREDDYH